jgi:predicted outer membrane lipoprotein
MNDLIVGMIALLTGAVFCFRGYLAMRIVIPLWGAFAGFMLGAGIVAGDAGFLATAFGWIVGLVVAVVFGLIAYLYYEVSVIIGMLAIGFVLGTSVMVALGVTWSWVIVLSGIVLAIALAFVGIVGDLPMVLLTILTALAGASTMVIGLMLLFNVVNVGEFNSGLTTEVLDDDWWWYVIFGVLVGAGMIMQFSDTDRRRDSLRAAWSDSDESIW